MITDNTFGSEWIRSIKTNKDFNRINPETLERMIYALHLLEHLQLAKLDFIFKGGTSLVLLFDKPKRFSVDIDILTKVNREELEKALDLVRGSSRFKKYELDERRSYREGGIPKAHYEFFYDSQISKGESSIMLDILFDENFYPVTIEAEVKGIFIETDDKPTVVKIPNINTMSGDKLTAFAPNTSGYRYGKGLELQIIKQLFDLGFLVDEISDFEEVFSTYLAKKKRLDIHFNNIWDENIIPNDIINTSLLLAKRGKGLADNEKLSYGELDTGIKRLETFLIKRPFHLEIAVESAAKAALCAAKIKTNNLEPIQKFEKGMELKTFLIENEKYKFLNKLLKNGTYALFYWNQVIELIG